MIYRIKYNGVELVSEDGHEWKSADSDFAPIARAFNSEIRYEKIEADHHDPIQLILSRISGILWLSDQPDESSDDLVEGETFTNSAPNQDALRTALAADLQPLGDALFAAANAGDEAAVRAAARKISERMPEFMESDALVDFLGEEMRGALNFNSPEEVFTNYGTPEGNKKGWETRRANGWVNRPKGTGKPKKAREASSIIEVLDAAYHDPDDRSFTDYQQLEIKDIAAIEARAGRPPAEVGSLEGMHRTLEAEKAMKILSKHAADKYPVMEEDFHSLPNYLSAPSEQKWETKKGQTPRLISTIRRGRDLLIVEEVQTGNQRLTVLSMYRP